MESSVNSNSQKLCQKKGCTKPLDNKILMFNQAIEEILRNSDKSRSLMSMIERWLNQFHLFSYVSAEEVVSEAYIRAILYIQREKTIEKPLPWLKSTAYNIIREKSRERRKQLPSDPQSVIFENMTSVCESEENLQVLLEKLTDNFLEEVFKVLELKTNSEDVRLIKMKWLNDLSWQEIREQLIKENGSAPLEATLRKRLSRTLSALKKYCRNIYPEF